MLTTRNIFIANLALSDIFLCAFTMPLTLVDLITKFWTLGENQVIIKNVNSYTSHKKTPYLYGITTKFFVYEPILIKITRNANQFIKYDLEGHRRSHEVTFYKTKYFLLDLFFV